MSRLLIINNYKYKKGIRMKNLLFFCILTQFSLSLICSEQPLLNAEQSTHSSESQTSITPMTIDSTQASSNSSSLSNKCSKNDCKRGCIIGIITAGVLTAILVPTIMKFTEKPTYVWPFPCIDQNDKTNMTNQCYAIQIANQCGSCDQEWGSRVRCPVNQPVTSAQLMKLIRGQLDPICGTSTQYCLSNPSCTSPDGYYTCVNDNLQAFVDQTKLKCFTRSSNKKQRNNTPKQLARFSQQANKYAQKGKKLSGRY